MTSGSTYTAVYKLLALQPVNTEQLDLILDEIKKEQPNEYAEHVWVQIATNTAATPEVLEKLHNLMSIASGSLQLNRAHLALATNPRTPRPVLARLNQWVSGKLDVIDPESLHFMIQKSLWYNPTFLAMRAKEAELNPYMSEQDVRDIIAPEAFRTVMK